MKYQQLTCRECAVVATARGDRVRLENWAARCRADGHEVALTVEVDEYDF